MSIHRAERAQRLDRIDSYVRGVADDPYMPREAGREYKLLAQRSKTNVLGLVVDVRAQALFVEGLPILGQLGEQFCVAVLASQCHGC